MPLDLTADMTAFQEQGYLVIPEVLGEAEVDAAQREIERLHELAAGEGSPPGEQSEPHPKGERSEPHSKSEATFQFEPHTDVRAERGRPVLRKVERTDLVSDLFAGMARNSRVVAVVSEILGPGAAAVPIDADAEAGAPRIAARTAPGRCLLAAGASGAGDREHRHLGQRCRERLHPRHPRQPPLAR